MQTLFSKPLLEELRPPLKDQVAALINRGIEPHLAVVLIGDNEDSLRYIDQKTKAAVQVGIILSTYHLEAISTFEAITETLQFLAADPEIHGIILQLPLPDQFTKEQTDQLIALIPAVKDVDGLRGDWESLTYSKYTTESLLQNQPYALPPMVQAVTSLLNHYDIPLDDKKIVIIGRGRLVGQPLEQFYKKLNLSVQTVDEGTEHILAISSAADLVITGTGQSELVTYQWVKEGAVVVDCSADVHVDSVSQVASALAPPKGGVGPLTIFWLLHNTYQAAKNQS